MVECSKMFPFLCCSKKIKLTVVSELMHKIFEFAEFKNPISCGKKYISI